MQPSTAFKVHKFFTCTIFQIKKGPPCPSCLHQLLETWRMPSQAFSTLMKRLNSTPQYFLLSSFWHLRCLEYLCCSALSLQSSEVLHTCSIPVVGCRRGGCVCCIQKQCSYQLLGAWRLRLGNNRSPKNSGVAVLAKYGVAFSERKLLLGSGSD